MTLTLQVWAQLIVKTCLKFSAGGYIQHMTHNPVEECHNHDAVLFTFGKWDFRWFVRILVVGKLRRQNRQL